MDAFDVVVWPSSDFFELPESRSVLMFKFFYGNNVLFQVVTNIFCLYQSGWIYFVTLLSIGYL